MADDPDAWSIPAQYPQRERRTWRSATAAKMVTARQVPGVFLLLNGKYNRDLESIDI